jgi:diketogulonate reductase-like aldo/keto reductase
LRNKWNQTSNLFCSPSLSKTNSMSAALHTVTFPNGSIVPTLGQGTWHIGEAEKERDAEIKALQLGLDLGMTLIDTAEMYSDGEAEKVVGQAISGRRADVHLVSKVCPHNASRKGAVAACERSLRRLKTDCLDLYLLHWRGSIPLQETLSAFEDLRQTGKIRSFGVSNFDKPDMEQIMELPGGDGTATNQVLYNLQRRGIEWDLLPWCRQRRIPVIAYSPIEQGRLLASLRPFGERRGLSPAQVALAWVLSQEGIIAIPKASNIQHVLENRSAAEIVLSEEDQTELDALYPRPGGKVPLEML